MIDERELLEKELERFTPDPGMVERVVRRRARKVRRQRVTAGALGIVIAAAVTVTAVMIQLDPGEKIQTPPTPSPSALPTPLIELDPGLYSVDIRTGAATPLAPSIASIRGATNFDVSPDGSRIVFDDSGIGGRPQPGRVQVYLANIDGSDVHRITDDPIGASDGSWSPDGSKIVYVGSWHCCRREPAALSVLDLETGTATVLAQDQWLNLRDPSFSLDGRSVYVTRWDRGPEAQSDLWEIPVAGGAPRLLLEDRGWATFALDGGSISYAWIETYAAGVGGHCFMDYGVAWISDADGSDPRVLDRVATSDHRGSWPIGWSPDGTTLAYSEDLFPLERNCTREHATRGVYVMDMETSGTTLVTFGEPLDWLDDRTLLVRAELTPEAGIGG